MSEAPLDPRDLERLDRAIERLTSNQPVPVFEDGELAELLELAGRLHHELPADLPDPVFRDSLREQLSDPRPRLVDQPGRKRPTRNPVALAGGAIAAVFVVAVAVTLAATAQFGGGDEGTDDPGQAELLGSRTNVAALATATATVGSVAVISTRDSDAPTPTPTPRQVTIPPVDSAHLEFGAMTTANAEYASIDEEITYTLSSSMPESPSSAPVYRFAVPEMDAMSLMNRVTDALELDGEMTTRSVRGKTVFSFTSTNGTTFTWMPASGAFACNLSGEARVSGSPEEMVAATYNWLRSSGFPIRDASVSPIIEDMEGGAMRVDFPVETAPEMAVGHPLSVSVVIDHRGIIKTVSGYFIQLVETHDIGLRSAEEAWQQLAEGKGYWASRTPIESSGQFEVESFQVSYVLTVDDEDELVLQPVYRATGKFHDYRGEVVEGVSVMIQAITQPGQ